MAARRLLCEFMVLSPLILMLALAVEARTSTSTFSIASYSQRTNAQLLRFQPLIAETADRLRGPKRADPREIARKWIAGFESGELQLPTPEYVFDTSRDGCRGDISFAVDLIGSALDSKYHESLKTSPDASVECLELALKLYSKLKYWDIQAVGYISMRERAFLNEVAQTSEMLSPALCKRALRAIEQIEHSDSKFAKCIKQIDRLNVMEGVITGQTRYRIIDPSLRLEVANSKRAIASVRTAILMTDDSGANSFVADGLMYSHQSYQNQPETIRQVTEILRARIKESR